MKLFNSKLKPRELMLMGGALFSMHFGGSSMIWPVTWGKQSGSSVFIAFTGIYLTAIFFPLLGYIALARAEGSFFQISKKISKRFAYIFCTTTILVLGPLFVIPRMSAAAWDSLLQVSGYSPKSFIPALIFSVIFYIIVYWFISKKSETMNKLSKFLLPILLIAVTAIFVKGFINPLSSWTEKSYPQNPFVYGFINGYSTVELPSALVFGAVIINNLKARGLEGKGLNRNLLIIGILGTSILTITHFLHMLLGSLTGNLFEGYEYASLYAKVVIELWGRAGGAAFNLALLFATLTSSIGLTAATSEYFDEMTQGKISYNKSAVFALLISTVVSTIGLKEIIKYTAPLLDIIYPAAITLTLYYAFVPDIIYKRRAYGALTLGVTSAFIWGIFEGILGYAKIFNLNLELINRIHDAFPLASYGLGWISITAAASVIGFVFLGRESRTTSDIGINPQGV